MNGYLFCLLNRDPEAKWFLECAGLIGGGAIFLTIWLTRKFAFAYLENKRTNEKNVQSILIGHIVISILIALILPNNYLIRIPSVSNAFEANGILIPLSMVGILILLLVGIGVVISSVCRLFK